MLNRIAAIVAIIAVSAFGGGGGALAFPAPAQATTHHGYHYTLRICAEYGGQPHWTWVREGSADSGWMIILKRGGGGTSIRYEVSSAGRYVMELNSDPPRYERFQGGSPQRWEYNPGPPPYYVQENDGPYVKIGPGTTDADFLEVTTHSEPFDRYARVAVHHGGLYTRWANMRFCR